jgi:hypothetical protein
MHQELPDIPTAAINDGEVRCPLGKQCKLSVINRDAILVECVRDITDYCPKAFSFGNGEFCQALMKPARTYGRSDDAVAPKSSQSPTPAPFLPNRVGEFRSGTGSA